MIKHKNIIATFHNVTNKTWFDDTIKFLSENYKLIATDDLHLLMHNGKPFTNMVHLTVDDGILSFYEVIFPVLQKYHVPATLFVSPMIIAEQKNFWWQTDKGLNQEKMVQIIADEISISSSKIRELPYHLILKCLPIDRIQRILEQYYQRNDIVALSPKNMTIDQLIEVEKSGLVTIGAHTINHPILSNESDEAAEYEIASSISELQSILGHPVNYFAYPNGLPDLDFGRREIEILRKSQIKLAFAGEFRSFNHKSDHFSMPRMGFSHGSKKTMQLKLMMDSLWPLLKALRNIPEERIRKRISNLISE